jgi:hypothetical protein
MRCSKVAGRTLVGAIAAVTCGYLMMGRATAQSIELGGCHMEISFSLKCPGSDFSKLDLRGLFFAQADLSGSNFREANLEDLDLWKTDLRNSNFSGANMVGVFLTGADLSGSDLRGADLRQAFVYRAKIDGANFAGANLEGARWVTGAICGPGSIGECKPLPPMADFDPRPLTWHLLPPACREKWFAPKPKQVAGAGQATAGPAPIPECESPTR